jgi:putative ABC transport system substrate-binding protein
MIGRREFITLLGGAVAWPLTARAQQGERMRRLGVLLNLAAGGSTGRSSLAPFTDALQELGWTEGRNLIVDYRWSGGDVGRIKTDVEELVRLQPDAIFMGGSAALVATRQATRTIPIVFANVADPVGQGFVESLARPGGNATGFTNFEFSMGGKWLEALKDIAPRVRRVALIVNPGNPNAALFLRSVETIAPSFGVATLPTPVRDKGEIESAIDALVHGSVDGLVVLPDGLALAEARLIVDLVSNHRLPVIYPFRDFVVEGGLISYGSKLSESYRQAADYVNRILRGANPAALPVQAPNKFELVINLKAAIGARD